MSRSTQDIVDNYLAPLMQPIFDFEELLGKQPDIKRNAKKLALLAWARCFLEGFIEMKEGRYETDEDLSPSEIEPTDAEPLPEDEDGGCEFCGEQDCEGECEECSDYEINDCECFS